MRMLFVMDPIASINIAKDTTFAFMLTAQQRGHEVFYTTLDGLGADQNGAWAHARRATLQRVIGDHATLGESAKMSFDEFGAIWMRKDPPVDAEFVHASFVLDLADPAKTLVVNTPAGLRSANEKAFILNFGDVTPRTMITRRTDDIHAFVASEGGRAVIKPLDLMGGAGIFLLHADDPNLNSILEQSTKYGREMVMVQEYLPQAKEGDKRVLIMDGEPLGAILRVPRKGEFRGNLAAGGSAVAAVIDEHDRRIIDAVLPRLRDEGLWFVGLDVIGGRLTEVNVTSPTGIQEVEKYDGPGAAAKVVGWVEDHAPG